MNAQKDISHEVVQAFLGYWKPFSTLSHRACLKESEWVAYVGYDFKSQKDLCLVGETLRQSPDRRTSSDQGNNKVRALNGMRTFERDQSAKNECRSRINQNILFEQQTIGLAKR